MGFLDLVAADDDGYIESAEELELVKTRASQMNGCAYCIDVHTKDARAAGETEQRLYALNAWLSPPLSLRLLNSGMNLCTGSLRRSAPRSERTITAAAVMGLVIDASRKT